MEWISVKDRLPDINKQVLVYDANSKGLASAIIHLVNGKVCFMGYGDDLATDITHWMPLPKPPKETK